MLRNPRYYLLKLIQSIKNTEKKPAYDHFWAGRFGN